MDKLNLQVRLAIILLIFFVLAVVLQIARSSYVADITIREEAESVAVLLNQLFDIADTGEQLTPNETVTDTELLQNLVLLENIRHLDLRIQSADSHYPEVNEDPRSTINALPWYIALVYPDPGDQIEAVWIETRARIIATFFFLVVLLVALVFLTIRWMNPVEVINEVLAKVEGGDFSSRLSKFSLPEFRKIGDHINHLTTRLGASKS